MQYKQEVLFLTSLSLETMYNNCYYYNNNEQDEEDIEQNCCVMILTVTKCNYPWLHQIIDTHEILYSTTFFFQF